MNKNQIRIEFLKKRRDLSESKIEPLNKAIHDLFFSRIPVHRYSVIHIYLPIKRNNEFNTFLLLNTLRKDFAPDIFVPKVIKDGEMEHLKLENGTQLINNEWFIPEPVSNSSLSNEAFFDTFKDIEIMVIVPLLAFDKQGNRIGYGKGFYDRFLGKKTRNCVIVGFSIFEALEEPILDISLHDISLDYCITPTKVWAW